VTLDRDDGLPRWPVLEDEIGEDPSRFLRFSSALALARIRGIDRLDVAREWIDVELELVEYRENGPRSAIIAELNRRVEELKQYRPDRRDAPREIDPSRKVDEVLFLDEDGEPRDRSETARSKLAELRQSGSAEAATDGGSEP
jgi:hypothetical protein